MKTNTPECIFVVVYGNDESFVDDNYHILESSSKKFKLVSIFIWFKQLVYSKKGVECSLYFDDLLTKELELAAVTGKAVVEPFGVSLCACVVCRQLIVSESASVY